MPGEIAWSLLAALAGCWELCCRRSRGRYPSLAKVCGAISTRLPGQIVLGVVWAFAGVHLFARYGFAPR